MAIDYGTESSLLRVLRRQRMLLAQRDDVAAGLLTDSYARAWSRVQRDLNRLQDRMEAAAAKGDPMGPSWLGQEARYRQLQASIATELGTWSQDAISTVRANVRGVLEEARDLVPPELEAGTFGGYTFQPWAKLPTRAIEQLTAATLGDGSPVRQLLARMPGDAGAAVRHELITGMALGKSPRDVARRARAAATGLSLTRALTISRTEMLRAYREATAVTFEENDHLLEGWVWQSAGNGRTCPACWAMHGTRHPLTERMESHPNCRCTQVPITKGWRDILEDAAPGAWLALPDAGRKAALGIPKGTDLFARLPPAQQRAILGPARYKLYNTHGVPLSSMMTWHNDPTWGRSPRLRSVRDLMAGEGISDLGLRGFGKPVPKPVPPSLASADIPAQGFATVHEAEAWLRQRFPKMTNVSIEAEYLKPAVMRSEYIRNADNRITGIRRVEVEPARRMPVDPVAVTKLMRELDRLATKFPWATRRLDTFRVKQGGWSSNTYAHANAQLIEVNSAYLYRRDTGGVRMGEAMASDIKGGYHPSVRPGEGLEDIGVLTHEFGHVIHFSALLDRRSSTTGAYIPRGTGVYTDTVAWAFSNFISTVKQTGGVVSQYARKSEYERFAEAFMARELQPRSEWKPYTRKVDELLTKLEQLPYDPNDPLS